MRVKLKRDFLSTPPYVYVYLKTGNWPMTSSYLNYFCSCYVSCMREQGLLFVNLSFNE